MTAKIFDVENLKRSVDEIVSKVKAGEVFIYPTDTVYGIGCNATNKKAVEKIFKIKERSTKKPLSIAFCSFEQLDEYVWLDEKTKEKLGDKLPGAYTFIVKNKKIPRVVTGGLDTIGIRIPNYKPILDIIKLANTPIVTTSANQTAKSPAKCLDEIDEKILGNVDFVLKEDICSGKPSIVINLIEGKKLR